MKAEVIARGLIIDNQEVDVGKVIDVSKRLFDRSVKLGKPGSSKKQISAEQRALEGARAQIASQQKDLKERVKVLDSAAAELSDREAELAKREGAITDREEAVTAAESELAKK